MGINVKKKKSVFSEQSVCHYSDKQNFIHNRLVYSIFKILLPKAIFDFIRMRPEG